MSRIGKKPILIPPGVTATKSDNFILIKGPKGELKREILPEISVEINGSEIIVKPARETKKTSALWGLTRALIAGMVEGAAKGFEKKLEIEGVGYKANVEGNALQLSLGFSHPVKFEAPPGISFKVEKNVITVSGASKELVGETAAAIRALKKPEPYKGKGIKYQGEVIRRKVGKKATATAAA
jgi:large subunit ribosomal protein L6